MQMEEEANKPERDLTRSVMTEKDIRKIIHRVFPDGIILTQSMIIAAAGKNLSVRLGYAEDKLRGLPLSTLTGQALPQQQLRDLLKTGFFEDHSIDLFHRLGQKYACQVTGFYLGIIADLNDMIVLQFQNLTSLLP
jgi:hypothetical protein